MRRLLPRVLLLALACALGAAAPAAAGGTVALDGVVLRFTADDLEPSNVTIDQLAAEGLLRLDENASRMTVAAGSPCTASEDGYRVECPAAGIERIEVQLGFLGSDVRIRAGLPALIRGGPGDDLLIGGPAGDAIYGGAGDDIMGGGDALDTFVGGPGDDLVTYRDRIGPDGALLPRRGAVTLVAGRENASGGFDERDTIEEDVEQLEGGAGADRFELRDGRATAVACGAGRDTVIADPRDVTEIDCETTRLAPPQFGRRMTVPTLPFPFVSVNDRGRSAIAVEPLLPLSGNAIVLRVSCPAGVGLLELVRALPCTGRVRFARGGTTMGTQRVNVPRGGVRTLRLPLTTSRPLARRSGGLAVTVTALPSRGDVQRALTFRVKG